MYKVRFHLAAGKHYMHWQVKQGKDVFYFNPSSGILILTNCILVNHKPTAQKILDGANKTVCAWIACENVNTWKSANDTVIQEIINSVNYQSILYNPKIKNHWRDLDGNDIDSTKFSTIVTFGRRVYGHV